MGEATNSAAGKKMEEFLEECSASGDAAYGKIRALLERLHDPATRSEARKFLAEIQRRFNDSDSSLDCFRKFHFRIHDVWLNDSEGQKRHKLTMMEIPSIFIPEDWSFTFYEGINRHPDSFFRDKTVAELGTGNGWISIALAQRWGPLKVYGLDINPRAVKIAWINLYLNALDENGQPIYDSEGKSLLDRVEFHESDLLAYCRDNKIELERIIGCIPQILNPNPEAMSKIITENSSEEFLYDLSNYCALQGFVEDQFGLGLIARAVEEGIAVIKPMGFLVLNMGGRPGQGVCRRLFERRGFRISKVWETKVMQAADTDISALVEIEKNSPHRFEFFMGLVADQPICARTASAYMKSGGRISHSLSVYSCQLRQPNQVKKIFEFLKDGFQEVSSALDLSFENDSVADEKIPFLADLATFLRQQSFLPYDSPAGWSNFCNQIAGFIKNYHRVPLSSDNVVVFPTRTVAIENVLRLFTPRLAIVDDQLTRQLPKQWLTSLPLEGSTETEIMVIEAPHRSDLLIELIKKLKPQVVITGIAHFEAITSSAFENLLRATRDVGSLLFLDISDHLELSSSPGSNGVLKYLASHILPSHAAILCGLVKNQVYSDLEVAFIISEDAKMYEALSKTVELLEGHTALFSQHYYGCLFHELLAFQITDRHPLLERESTETGSTSMIGFSPSANTALNESEFFIHAINSNNHSPIIHMDLDQNLLPLPSLVKSSIYESFARQNLSELEFDVAPGIKQLVKSRYGYPVDALSDIICGNSCLALFNKLVSSCISEKGTFIFPMGSNGHYMSAAQFMKCNVGTIPTKPENGFKLLVEDLKNALKSVEKPWVYISGPTVNPSGSVYSDSEINGLLTACAEYGARVVIDTSFSGLEFEASSNNSSIWNLKQSICNQAGSGSQKGTCVILLGGLSFELLAGGFDFGFLLLNEPDPDLAESVGNFFRGLSRPHGISKYAVRKLLGLKNGADNRLLEAIEEEKERLRNRAGALTKTLTNCGWDVLACHGGVSLVAKPTQYLGKMVKIDDTVVILDGTNIREALLKSTGLCINGGAWTRLPDYCRFSFSLDQSKFEQSLDRIDQFKKIVLG